MSELKNALRSGDIWVVGSRQFKEFDEYLLTRVDYAQRVRESRLGLQVPTQCREYLEERLTRLRESIAATEALAAAGELPDAQISDRRAQDIALDQCGARRGQPARSRRQCAATPCEDHGPAARGRSLDAVLSALHASEKLRPGPRIRRCC